MYLYLCVVTVFVESQGFDSDEGWAPTAGEPRVVWKSFEVLLEAMHVAHAIAECERVAKDYAEQKNWTFRRVDLLDCPRLHKEGSGEIVITRQMEPIE